MTDDEIDLIHNWVDSQFSAGEFCVVNAVLSALRPEHMGADELITWLTVTLPAKSKLPARHAFYIHLQQEADDERLWSGLG